MPYCMYFSITCIYVHMPKFYIRMYMYVLYINAYVRMYSMYTTYTYIHNNYSCHCYCPISLWLYQLCRGVDHEVVKSRQLAQSVGCGKNFLGPEKLHSADQVHISTHFLHIATCIYDYVRIYKCTCTYVRMYVHYVLLCTDFV